jgi:hypothetical protein
MHTPLHKYQEWASRLLSALAAVALAFVTFGTLVIVPAELEARGVEVRMPHVDETGPRMAVTYSD